jgi:hypothetical protein
MSGLLALATKLFISMTLLFLRCECLQDGATSKASLVTQLALALTRALVLALALAINLVLRFILSFVRTKLLVTIFAILPKAIALTTTITIAIRVVMWVISASQMWRVDPKTVEKIP